MRNRKYDWRRLRRIAAAVLLLAGALSGCAARAGADSPWKFFTGGTDTEPLTAAFLKAGKADAIVLVHAGEALVIDCGEEEDGAEVVEYLKARNISRISALIITHFDQDHVGGADTVAEQMEIGRVLLPAYEGSGSEYADLLSALDAKGIEPELLAGPLTFRFGEAEVLVSPPDSYEVPAGVTEFDNNFSLITTVTHGKMRLVFAGDIEKQRIRAYLETGAAQKYYDTPDSLLIRRSLDKPLYKEKLRLRSYGIPSMDTTVYLEIKKKYEGIVNKRRIALPLREAYAYLERGIRPERDSQILREMDAFLARYPLERGLYLAYDRIALFGTEDPEFRVTFDTRIRSRRSDIGLEAGDRGTLLLPEDMVLMESKFLGAAPLWFVELLADLRIYPASFSKYGSVYQREMQTERRKELQRPVRRPADGLHLPFGARAGADGQHGDALRADVPRGAAPRGPGEGADRRAAHEKRESDRYARDCSPGKE